MGPLNRRQFLTSTGAGLAGILATRVAPARGQQREISTSAGTTSPPRPTRSWPRSASASPRTPASSSRSTTSPTWAPQQAQVRLRGPDPGRPRHGGDADALPVALRAAARRRLGRGGRAREAVRQGPRVGLRGRARQRGVARGAPVPQHLRRRLPGGPLQEGLPQGPGHVGGPLRRRERAQEDGQPGRDPHQSELRLDLDGGPGAVVVRRHGGGQGRQDGEDQLAGHRADHRVVQEDVQ